MNLPLPPFLHAPDGEIMIVGHRIGLHHVVRLYREGYSPEMVWETYPSLSLAVIYRCIAIYLENRLEVDGYMAQRDTEVQRQIETFDEGRTEPLIGGLRRRVALRERLANKRQAEEVQRTGAA